MTPTIRPGEQLLIDLIPELGAARLLANTAGRGQFVAEFVRQYGGALATCWLLDLYQCQQCRFANHPLPGNLQFACQAEPPPQEYDLVAWLFSHRGEAELVREMLQLGHQRLAIGGRMAVATDNPDDQWLHELLRGMFSKVTRRPDKTGTVYLATKQAPLKKVKDYACDLTFRDGERLIHLRTRPGVFSHREVDGGARALVKTMEIQPSQRVLDLGCGSGAVGIAAALRAEDVRVTAIDSNPRAIESARWASERNGCSNFHATLDCDGSTVEPGGYDLVLANPPYYSNYRIAELFVQLAGRALAPGGRLLVVTKTPEWYLDRLADGWSEPIATAVGDYAIVSAVRSN